ncbi:MAG: rhombosortase [Betaproteobacteria bacterium]
MAEAATAPARQGWRAWAALAALLAAGSALAWPLPSALLDWQPDRALAEPWRAFTAAFVHWSEGHLFANLGAAALVAAYGWAAALPRAAALAWLLAWPLTHLGLLLRPELAHYGGLSGVLHAGVAVATLWLVVAARGSRRVVGVLMGAGLLAKLLSERPWAGVLQQAAGWDIALAPIGHATGAIAGLACAAALLAWRKNHRP